MDDRISWSNLCYLAVSRVEYGRQLRRCCPPPELDGPPGPPEDAADFAAEMQRNIARKLAGYKQVDAAKGHANNLRAEDVLTLREKQGGRCAVCNCALLWCWQPKDTRQFSVDRLDNAQGHTRDNVRLTCLECNRRRGAAALR